MKISTSEIFSDRPPPFDIWCFFHQQAWFHFSHKLKDSQISRKKIQNVSLNVLLQPFYFSFIFTSQPYTLIELETGFSSAANPTLLWRLELLLNQHQSSQKKRPKLLLKRLLKMQRTKLRNWDWTVVVLDSKLLKWYIVHLKRCQMSIPSFLQK